MPVTFKNISKRFGGVQALNNISFAIKPGTIHALVGENGAGKSTLIKCLVGVHQPDEGQILFENTPIAPSTPGDARKIGIDIVFQEIELAPNLTVAESIFLAREPKKFGIIDRKQMESKAAIILESLSVPISPTALVETLSTAEKQSVQIARALAEGTKVLVMDEPTSSLSDYEIDKLLTLLESLRDKGTTILYVSHKLNEIFRISNTITVMRDGCHIETLPASEYTPDTVISAMIGKSGPSHSISVKEPRQNPLDSESILSVRNLTQGMAFRNVSFDLYKGEILGFFGIVGAGRTELMRAIFGVDPYSGEIIYNGQPVRWKSPSQAIKAGLALVPEDRKLQGLLLEESLKRNMALTAMPLISQLGWINLPKEQAVSQKAVKQFSIAARSGIDQEVRFLSGGNQQKVVIAKWIATNPKILILDEPTKGIDVGAKSEVHSLVRRFAGEGMSVILISSEMDEILALSDRIQVMRAGTLTATFDSANVTREEMMSAAVFSAPTVTV